MQDLAFQVVGLAWANASASETAKKAAHALSALQCADGGWSQFPGLESDAYATGQALYALRISGRVPATDAVHRKGIDYLLTTQAVDGSWQTGSSIGAQLHRTRFPRRTCRACHPSANDPSHRRKADCGRG
jgi:hypothetical protein